MYWKWASRIYTVSITALQYTLVNTIATMHTYMNALYVKICLS